MKPLNYSNSICLSWTYSVWKSTIINLLWKLWYNTYPEVARTLLWNYSIPQWKMTEEQKSIFQHDVINQQLDLERRLRNSNNGFVVDTWLLESLPYSESLSDYNDIKKTILEHYVPYDYLFVFPLLNTIEDDWTRLTDSDYQEYIHRKLLKNYHDLWISYMPLWLKGTTMYEQTYNKLYDILTIVNLHLSPNEIHQYIQSIFPLE